MHLPHLIGPFEHYLWILKTTHSGEGATDHPFDGWFERFPLGAPVQWTLETAHWVAVWLTGPAKPALLVCKQRVPRQRVSAFPRLLRLRAGAGLDTSFRGYATALSPPSMPPSASVLPRFPCCAGADLDTSFTMAQGLMDGDLCWNIRGKGCCSVVEFSAISCSFVDCWGWVAAGVCVRFGRASVASQACTLRPPNCWSFAGHREETDVCRMSGGPLDSVAQLADASAPSQTCWTTATSGGCPERLWRCGTASPATGR